MAISRNCQPPGSDLRSPLHLYNPQSAVEEHPPHFRFMDLPFDVRNMIYHAMFFDPECRKHVPQPNNSAIDRRSWSSSVFRSLLSGPTLPNADTLPGTICGYASHPVPSLNPAIFSLSREVRQESLAAYHSAPFENVLVQTNIMTLPRQLKERGFVVGRVSRSPQEPLNSVYKTLQIDLKLQIDEISPKPSDFIKFWIHIADLRYFHLALMYMVGREHVAIQVTRCTWSFSKNLSIKGAPVPGLVPLEGSRLKRKYWLSMEATRSFVAELRGFSLQFTNTVFSDVLGNATAECDAGNPWVFARVQRPPIASTLEQMWLVLQVRSWYQESMRAGTPISQNAEQRVLGQLLFRILALCTTRPDAFRAAYFRTATTFPGDPRVEVRSIPDVLCCTTLRFAEDRISQGQYQAALAWLQIACNAGSWIEAEPGSQGWAMPKALRLQLAYWRAFASVQLGSCPGSVQSLRQLCAWLKDGEDGDVTWRNIADAIEQELPTPPPEKRAFDCVLIEPHEFHEPEQPAKRPRQSCQHYRKYDLRSGSSCRPRRRARR